jgi:hypothetical protein
MVAVHRDGSKWSSMKSFASATLINHGRLAIGQNKLFPPEN